MAEAKKSDSGQKIEMNEGFTETHNEGKEPVYFILKYPWENLAPIKLAQLVDH
jgi:hypothetical protein